MRSARPTAPSLTARRSSTTGSRVSPGSIPLCSVRCAAPRPMPRTTGSSSSSTAAGDPRPTRSSSYGRRSRSTAPRRRPADGWPPPTRLRTCRATRSTSGPPMPRRGCPRTAPRTGCAGSTATSHGTTSCARRRPRTAARRCTPIRRTIHGCSDDHEKNAADVCRSRRGRPDRCGLRLGRAFRDRQHRHHEEDHRPRQGGAVLPVHAGERRPGVPGPGRVGRADDRRGRERLVAGHERRVLEGRHRRLQAPGAVRVHGPPAQLLTADGGPAVRAVHPRERRDGLPGPRSGCAPRRHEPHPILRTTRWHDRPERRDAEVQRHLLRQAGAGEPVKRRTMMVVAAAVFATSCGKGANSTAPRTPVNTAKVQKGPLSALVSLSGILTYRSPYSVINRARGTYTELPAAGDKADCGDVLYRVDEHPVLLLCGAVPAYRDLHAGDSGRDVWQLNRNLRRLGYHPGTGAAFTPKTERALSRFQHRKGLKVTGRLRAPDAVFLPEAVRIAKVTGGLGGRARPGAQVAQATSDTLGV